MTTFPNTPTTKTPAAENPAYTPNPKPRQTSTTYTRTEYETAQTLLSLRTTPNTLTPPTTPPSTATHQNTNDPFTEWDAAITLLKYQASGTPSSEKSSTPASIKDSATDTMSTSIQRRATRSMGKRLTGKGVYDMSYHPLHDYF